MWLVGVVSGCGEQEVVVASGSGIPTFLFIFKNVLFIF